MQNPNMISEDIHASVSFFHDEHLIAKMPEATAGIRTQNTLIVRATEGDRSAQVTLVSKASAKILRCQKPEIQPILLVNNCRFECTPKFIPLII